VRTVIVDEIHAMADDKRGAHLALSLARLDDLCEKAGGKARSASAVRHRRPIETVARFLAPEEARRSRDQSRPPPRDGPARGGAERRAGPVASNEMWQEIYDRLTALITSTDHARVRQHQAACRARRAPSGRRLGEDAVLAHHGSLSRKLRLTAEERLKEGKLKAVVATGVSRAWHRHRHR
jgi:ATP-dependent Lhr-like helicase